MTAAQDVPLDLAGTGLGQFVHELHRAGALVARDALQAHRVDVVRGDVESLAGHDNGFDGLAPARIRHTDHRDFGHTLQRGDGGLDLGREDIETTRDDHVLLAVDDTSHALEWLRDHAAEFGGDPDRILIGGDSAGANLAAAALASGKPDFVSAALLLYGIYDVHRAMPVLTDLAGGPDPESQLYLEPDDMRQLDDDPRLHPERYCDRFPPSLVLVGEDDPLHHESASLVTALTDAGVANRYVSIPDAPHGFMQMPTHPAHARGLRAIEQFVAHTYPNSPGGTHR